MSRIFPLTEEIKMHVLTWETDPEFKKLSKSLIQALTTVINEIKVHDALISTGAGELNEDETSLSKERKKFIAIFKQRYLQEIDFEYKEPINGVVMAILTKVVERLLTEGTNSKEYLDWLWDEFFVEERNKKYLPPTIQFVCSSWIIDKFIFLKKDSLRIRKKDLVDATIKNIVLELAVKFMETTKDKDFGNKTLNFTRGEITINKFLDIFKKFAIKYKDENILNELNKINI